jgi:RNA polymerase sigma-70 factor (ECF subfamily)
VCNWRRHSRFSNFLPHFGPVYTLTFVTDTTKVRISAVCIENKTNVPDAELVGRTLRGDAAAFEDLVRRYERSARAIAYTVLKNWHAAQDAAQDAFLNAYLRLASLRQSSKFGPWLLKIAHNQARANSRAHRVHQPLDLANDQIAVDGEAENLDDMLYLIAQLANHERAVITLRYIEGHDVAMIAQIRSCSVGTVTKQLSRAHARLQKFLLQRERQ